MRQRGLAYRSLCYRRKRMSSGHVAHRAVGVAEAKRRFSELLDRVGAGERVVVNRRGRAAAVLVPASTEALAEVDAAPVGLAAVAGALADWDDLDAVADEILRARATARDRPAPDLE